MSEMLLDRHKKKLFLHRIVTGNIFSTDFRFLNGFRKGKYRLFKQYVLFYKIFAITVSIYEANVEFFTFFHFFQL